MPKLATRQRMSRINAYLTSVQISQGPPPSNVFRVLRERSGLTLQGYADACEVSKQTIIRQEQGVFTDPVDRVVDYVLANRTRFNYDGSYPDLVNSYYDYQKAMRARHKYLFGLQLVIASESGRSGYNGTHPFARLLQQWSTPEGSHIGRLNVTEVAKLLCVSQSVLDHWLNKPHRQQSIPIKFQEALRDNGYSRAQIEELNQMYKVYLSLPVGNQLSSVSHG